MDSRWLEGRNDLVRNLVTADSCSGTDRRMNLSTTNLSDFRRRLFQNPSRQASPTCVRHSNSVITAKGDGETIGPHREKTYIGLRAD